MAAAVAFLAYAAVMAVFLWSASKDHVVTPWDTYSVRTKLLMIPVIIGWVVPLLLADMS